MTTIYIVHEEDCVDAVYFLVRGHVKILKDGDVIGILSKSVFLLQSYKYGFHSAPNNHIGHKICLFVSTKVNQDSMPYPLYQL